MSVSETILGSIILEAAPDDSTREETIITNLGNSKRVVALATFQDLDVRNRNGRYYAKTDIKPEIEGARIQELIDAHQLFSEYSHPLSDDIVRQQTIDPKFKCCEIMKLWVEGNKVKGHYRGTFNEYGATIDEELRNGAKHGFSLRALGSIREVDGKPYVKGLKIITYDQVVYPSHRPAYTEKIISESCIEYNTNKSAYREAVEEMNRYGKVITLTGKDATEVLNRLQHESASVGIILETFEGIANEVSVTKDNKLRLSTYYGESLYLNLDEHVDNLITNYVCG